MTSHTCYVSAVFTLAIAALETMKCSRSALRVARRHERDESYIPKSELV